MPFKDPQKNKERMALYYQKNKAKIISKGMKREARRRRHLNRYKKSKGCQHCRYDENPIALDFHHVGGKDKGVAGMLSNSRKKIFTEVRKCIVLCANCHRIEQNKERS